VRTSGDRSRPFLAYLSEAGRVSEAELRELEDIVARLSAGHREER
jgi:hypothetical protein